MTPQERRSQRLEKLSVVCGDEGAWNSLMTLEAIEALTAVDGRPPTYREVSQTRKITVPGVQHQVGILTKAGLLSNDKSSRSFRVLDRMPPFTEGPWHDVLRATIPRENTRRRPGTIHVNEAIMRIVSDSLDEVDLIGSEVEIFIRHRP